MRTSQQNNFQGKNYIPVILRPDLLSPRFDQSQFQFQRELSISRDSDYFENEEDYYIERQELILKNKRRFGVLGWEMLGLSQQVVQDLQENIKREKFTQKLKKKLKISTETFEDIKRLPSEGTMQLLLIQKRKQQQDYYEEDDNFTDFLSSNFGKQKVKSLKKGFSKDKKKKKKPWKKWEEDEIVNYSEEKLREFLEYSFIPGEYQDEKYSNEKGLNLRKINVIFKHPHLNLQTMVIKNFFIPRYVGKISDLKNAHEEFDDWLNYLIKYLDIRDQDGEYFHLINGVKVRHFGEVPNSVNWFMIGGFPENSFWKDFQKQYGLSLSFQQIKEFVQDLNQILDKDEGHRLLLSLTLTQQTLFKREKQRMIKREEFKQKKIERKMSLPLLRLNRSIESQIKNQQNNSLSNTNLKFKKIIIDNPPVLDDLSIIHESVIQQRNKTAKEIQQRAIQNVERAIQTSTKSLFRGYKNKQKPINIQRYAQTTPNLFRNKNPLIEQFQNKIKKPLKPRNFSSNKINSNYNPNSSIIRNIQTGIQKSEGLFKVYPKYSEVLKKQVEMEVLPPKNNLFGTPANNSKKYVNIGSVMKSFNQVRMKIMLNSLPLIIQNRQNMQQSQTTKNIHSNHNDSFQINNFLRKDKKMPEIKKTNATSTVNLFDVISSDLPKPKRY